MTSPQEGLSLALVVHDDAYLPVVSLTDGWGEGYQKKAAVVRLAKADMEKLGLKPGGRVEITGPAASVVVVARPEACTACHWCDSHCPDMAIVVRRLEPDEVEELEELVRLAEEGVFPVGGDR